MISLSEMVEQFRDAMRAHGLVPPARIQADGEIHRCDVEGPSGKNDGAYLLHADGRPNGGFQNWQTDPSWCYWAPSGCEPISDADRAKQRERAEHARREREAAQAEAAALAEDLWAKCSEAPADHAYLAKKRIAPHGTRIYTGTDLKVGGMPCTGALVVPVRDADGRLTSLEFINAEGEERSLSNGRREGCYFSCGVPGMIIVVAEGFSTAASIHEATGHASVAAFGKNNLRDVSEILQHKHPTARLVIAADNDITEGKPNGGLMKATEAAFAVGGLLAVPELCGRSCDFNDVFTATGAEAVKSAIERASDPLRAEQSTFSGGILNSEPVPLTRSIPQPEPFPMTALGPILGPAAAALVELVQVPDALAANSVLAMAALAAQPHGDVETLGGPRPVSLFMLTVAESGERKTTVDRIVTEAARDRMTELQTEYGDALRQYEAKVEAYKLRVKLATDANKECPEALENQLTAIKLEEPPRKPFILITDPTVEGLVLALQDGQRSQGLFNDEGGQVIGGHALSDDAELRTITTLSKLWDGSSVDRVRAKDREHVVLRGRRLSVHLLCQPAVANRLLGKSLYRSQGLLARFLIAAPVSRIGSRLHSGDIQDPRDDARIRTYYEAVRVLLLTKPHEDPAYGGLSPPLLRLSPEARTRLVAAYNEIESAQAPDGELEDIREFASKAAEQACRIAAVLTLVSDPEALQISLESMDRALQLVQFYLYEQERLAGAAQTSPDIENAQALLSWIARKNVRTITARDVMQRGPSRIRDGVKAKTALQVLVDFQWLECTGSSYRVTVGAIARLWGTLCSG